MLVEGATPAQFAGDLMSDFNVRRGKVCGMELKGELQTIRAMVPMSEMLSYQDDLVSKTQGRASFQMQMDHYEFVPNGQAEKISEAGKSIDATGLGRRIVMPEYHGYVAAVD